MSDDERMKESIWGGEYVWLGMTCLIALFEPINRPFHDAAATCMDDRKKQAHVVGVALSGMFYADKRKSSVAEAIKVQSRLTEGLA